MWSELKGKACKFVLKDGNDVYVYYGKVVWASDTFIAERDRFGRLHFLNTSSIERISEVKHEVKEKQDSLEKPTS